MESWWAWGVWDAAPALLGVGVSRRLLRLIFFNVSNSAFLGQLRENRSDRDTLKTMEEEDVDSGASHQFKIFEGNVRR